MFHVQLCILVLLFKEMSCILESPPPAYSPPEESQHAPSPALSRDAMDTTNVPEVAPVSYQVSVSILVFILFNLKCISLDGKFSKKYQVT